MSLDSYGVNRRLVLRKMDLSYDSFDFTLERGSGAIARKKLLRTWSRPGLLAAQRFITKGGNNLVWQPANPSNQLKGIDDVLDYRVFVRPRNAHDVKPRLPFVESFLA